MTTQAKIESVKRAKAHKLYWDDVKRYGSEGHALRALDCRERDEAIAMLAAVQRVSVFKYDGEIVVN